MNRDEAIERIKAALKKSGKAWSVTGGRGTSYGYIDVQAPPRRRDEHGFTSDADCAELQGVFNLRASVHCQGLSITPEARAEYVSRAEAFAKRLADPQIVRLAAMARANHDQAAAAQTAGRWTEVAVLHAVWEGIVAARRYRMAELGQRRRFGLKPFGEVAQ